MNFLKITLRTSVPSDLYSAQICAVLTNLQIASMARAHQLSSATRVSWTLMQHTSSRERRNLGQPSGVYSQGSLRGLS